MSDELVFYTNPMSRGRIVRWMLEELGRPYQTELIDYASKMKSPDYLAINPMGKVPALRHGDTVVTEAGAICAYLADAFPEAGLAPALGDPARGPYFRWLFFGAGVVEPAFVAKSLGFTVAPDQQRRAGWGSFDDAFNTLEAAVAGTEYLAGGRFSAADVYIAAELGFLMQTGVLEKRPAFVTYATNLQARPAAQRAKAIDDELTAAMQR
jgi:glutathione S-transferase